MNTGDVQIASGKLAMFYKPTLVPSSPPPPSLCRTNWASSFPHPIGIEGSGVVVAVGKAVKSLRVGDAVYGMMVEKPMFRSAPPAMASDYAVVEERHLLRKPEHLSFEDAATMAGFVTTAYQVLRRGLQLGGWESLEGRTVFVPGALSGTGSVVAQVAKSVFAASRVVSTVSTPKMGLVETYLPGVVDQLVDYQTQSVPDAVGRRTVDLVVNTQWSSFADGVPLLKPDTGVYMSITSVPDKATAKEIIGEDRWSWWLGPLLDLAGLYYSWRFWGTKIPYEMLSGSPHIREDLEKAGEIVAAKKVKAVRTVVDLDDMDAVRKACGHVDSGKGGIGKLVIRIAS
jgi:NADPH:quinone reductase-like Zn-dependent oxidoreductase